jgi:FtsH-binding integral membrane protein
MDITFNNIAAQSRSGTVQQAFGWMSLGLAVTALAAWYVATNETLLTAIFSSNLIFFGIIIAELALVFFLSFRVQKMSFGAALTAFTAYSVLNGVTLSAIFLLYTATSIVSTLVITALVLGAMAAYGYTTKRDLTTIGSLAFMGLIGIIIASVVNLFLANDTFSYVISYLAIAIFIGLTAYDTQKIKNMEIYAENQNLGILGALMLYLDFVNIFLNLLRIWGRRRES